MTDAAWMFTLFACIAFLLAAAGISLGRVQVGWLGLFLLTLYVVLAGLPVSAR